MMTRTIRTTCAAAVLTFALAACAADNDADQQAAGDTVTTPAPQTPPPAPTDANALLDPNTVTREQLIAIPQLNDATADAIIAGRPYANMLAVDSVLRALPEADRDSVYTRLFLPLDLNSATAQEIQLIPGIGDRMTHEFEEYRPYVDIAQFRREIGKYVDAAEVARLERYVTIRR